ncbi:MAG: TetR/AcrR family transcriptional regulator [Pseudomonadota bacterium]
MQLFKEPMDKREKILQAAWDLAEEQGYNEVTMRNIATQAGLGKSTLYRLYTTKEQVFRDVTIAWGREFAHRLQARPAQGNTVGERLGEIVRRVIQEALRHPKVISAYLAWLMSDHSVDKSNLSGVQSLTEGLMTMAQGELKSENHGVAMACLGQMILASIQLTAAGAMSARHAVKEIKQTAEILLADIWHQSGKSLVKV